MHARRLSTVKPLALLLGLALLPLSLTAKPREVWETYKIAVIAGDGESPETKAIEAGAQAAAPALEDEYYLAITIDNLSPPEHSAQARNKALHQAFLDEYDGVLLYASDSSDVAEQINFLTRHSIPVVLIGNDVASPAAGSYHHR